LPKRLKLDVSLMVKSFLLLLISTVAVFAGSNSFAEAPSYYLIGNSLTWDTVPSLLDGDVQWHVDCGKSLPFIYNNPAAPCVKSSTLWPKALKERQYDFISVQTHYGATLKEDTEVISKWVKMQPKAVFIIHTGWARSATRAEEYANTDTKGTMQHSPAYVNALLAALRTAHPKREFRQTHAIDLLAKIATDVENKEAPIADVNELYRDAIHVHVKSARYLMHNAMRKALGQSASKEGFPDLDPKLKDYFDKVLATIN